MNSNGAGKSASVESPRRLFTEDAAGALERYPANFNPQPPKGYIETPPPAESQTFLVLQEQVSGIAARVADLRFRLKETADSFTGCDPEVCGPSKAGPESVPDGIVPSLIHQLDEIRVFLILADEQFMRIRDLAG